MAVSVSMNVEPAPATSTAVLKHRSVVVMIVLTLVTLGFYYPVWFLRRRTALNQLDSPKKLPAWPFVALIAFFGLQFALGMVAGPVPIEYVIGTSATMFLGVAQWALMFVLLWQSFRTKDILEHHLNRTQDDGPSFYVTQAKLSGVLTFFLHIFYLQHVINRDVVRSPEPV